MKVEYMTYTTEFQLNCTSQYKLCFDSTETDRAVHLNFFY